jgi:hypothetical protein
MKKLVTKIVIMLTFVFTGISTQAQNVNIPDAIFKAALLSNASINTNLDTAIQVSEAAAFTGVIEVSESNMSDLTGIRAFTALTGLSCSRNYLTSLDVSGCTALIGLGCSENQLTSLNISGCTALIGLGCNSNNLTSLDVSGLTALTRLDCHSNHITSLNLSAYTALTNLNCFNNYITSLNVTADTALGYLNCASNLLTNLNVTANTALGYLNCASNLLTNLNVSSNNALSYLNCAGNFLTSLNVSTNTALGLLYCHANQLTSLDVSSNATLSDLICHSNQLLNLNVSNGLNKSMISFAAGNNPNLKCIEVDDASWSAINLHFYVDSIASFSEDCSALGILDNIQSNTLLVYPNPTNNIINIEGLNINENNLVQIFDVQGKLVITKTITEKETIDLSELNKGVYVIKIGEVAQRIVKM